MRKNKRIGVIGGGAAGMMAAITAARAGQSVTILEGGERLGKKILSTGNGKCNLGNRSLSSENYYGSHEFLSKAFKRFGTEETLKFFHELGLLTKERNGYLYPLCEQASAVLDVLRFEVSALGIFVKTNFYVNQITKAENGKWIVQSKEGKESFDAIIISCGGKAMPKTGSDGSGYELAKKLGHHVRPVVPALTFLKCQEDFFKSIAGVRTEARIELLDHDGNVLASELGELQLTNQGISGIPVFQLSRIVSYALKKQKEVPLRIDFLPGLKLHGNNAEELISTRLRLREGRTVEECMTGILPKKVMELFLKKAGLKLNDSAQKLTDNSLRRLLEDCKGLMVKAIGTGDFSNCQVCAGGVEISEVTENMESKLAKGVYFAGEILDVDGKCGGYNLQWAWTSGYLAGLHAAERQEN